MDRHNDIATSEAAIVVEAIPLNVIDRQSAIRSASKLNARAQVAIPITARSRSDIRTIIERSAIALPLCIGTLPVGRIAINQARLFRPLIGIAIRPSRGR
jgi:hypothetical protein